MRVPITTLTPVTRSDWPTVSLIAAQDCGFVSVSTYPRHPSSPAVATIAANGIRTSRLNHIMAIPSPRLEPAVSVDRTPGRPRPTARVS